MQSSLKATRFITVFLSFCVLFFSSSVFSTIDSAWKDTPINTVALSQLSANAYGGEAATFTPATSSSNDGSVTYRVAVNVIPECSIPSGTTFSANSSGQVMVNGSEGLPMVSSDGQTQCIYTLTLFASDSDPGSEVQNNNDPYLQFPGIEWPMIDNNIAPYGSHTGLDISQADPDHHYHYNASFSFLADATVSTSPGDYSKVKYTAVLNYTVNGGTPQTVALDSTTSEFTVDENDPRGRVGIFKFTLPYNMDADSATVMSLTAVDVDNAALTKVYAGTIALPGSRATAWIPTANRNSDDVVARYSSTKVDELYPQGYLQPITYGAQIVSRRPIQYGMLVVTMKPSAQRGMVSAAYTFDYHPYSPNQLYLDWNWNEIDIEFVRNTLQQARYYQYCGTDGGGVWNCHDPDFNLRDAFDDAVSAFKNSQFDQSVLNIYTFNTLDVTSDTQAKEWALRSLPNPYANEWLSGMDENKLGTVGTPDSGLTKLLKQASWSDIQWAPLFNLKQSNRSGTSPPVFQGVSFDFWNVANKTAGDIYNIPAESSSPYYGWRGSANGGDVGSPDGTIAANTIQDFFVPLPLVQSKLQNMGGDFYTNFHTYTIVWTPKKIAFYVDAPNSGTGIDGITPVYERDAVSAQQVQKSIKKVMTRGAVPTASDFDTWKKQALGIENMGDNNPLYGQTTHTIYDVNYGNSQRVNPNAEYQVPWPNIMLNIWTDAPGTDQYICDGDHANDPNCGAGGWGGMVPIQFTQGSFSPNVDPSQGTYPALSTAWDQPSLESDNSTKSAVGVTAALYKEVDFYPLKGSSGSWNTGDKFSDFISATATDGYSPPPPGQPLGSQQRYAFKTNFTQIDSLEGLVNAGWFVSNNAYGQSISANIAFQHAFKTNDGIQGHYLALCDTYLANYMPKITWQDGSGNTNDYNWPLYATGCSGRFINATKDGARQTLLVVQSFGVWDQNNGTNPIQSVVDAQDASKVAGVVGGFDGWGSGDQGTGTVLQYVIPGSESTAAANPGSYTDANMKAWRNTLNIGHAYYIVTVQPGKQYVINSVPSLSSTGGVIYPHVCIGGQLTNTTNMVQLGDVGADRVYYADVFWTVGEDAGFQCPSEGGDPAYVEMNHDSDTPYVQWNNPDVKANAGGTTGSGSFNATATVMHGTGNDHIAYSCVTNGSATCAASVNGTTGTIALSNLTANDTEVTVTATAAGGLSQTATGQISEGVIAPVLTGGERVPGYYSSAWVTYSSPASGGDGHYTYTVNGFAGSVEQVDVAHKRILVSGVPLSAVQASITVHDGSSQATSNTVTIHWP